MKSDSGENLYPVVSPKSCDKCLYGGSWTPTMDEANVTYDRRWGTWRKIGDLVYITFELRGTINSVYGNKYAFISGLPYSAVTQQAGCLFECANCFSDANNTVRLLRVVNSQIGIQNGSGGGASISIWASGKGTFYLAGSATYICG